MKSKSGVLIALILMGASAAYSQVEVDDMYFNSKDRAKLEASKPVSFANTSQADDARIGASIPTVNPTDSYSGRGENPDYTSSNGSLSNPQYFVSNYQPTGVNQSLSNSYSGYGSPYYGNSYSPYGYGMNSMYGNPYNSFYSPYSMGYGYGMGYGMGYSSFGMGYGMGYGMSPYSMMSFGYGSGYGMGYPYGGMMGYGYGMGYYGGYGGYGYPSTTHIINESGNTFYGRGSRNSAVNNSSYYSRSPISTASNSQRPGIVSGRTSGQSAQTSQYYQRGWKTDPSLAPAGSSSRTSSWGNSGTNSNWGARSSSWGNGNTNSNWGGSNSRSSFGSGSSGGGFSGGGGGGGFSGGGRGRH